MARISRVGIIGLGIMGRGIAEACAAAGFNVVALELDSRKREAFTEANSASHVSASADPASLVACDLVIEAAPEDLELKRTIFETVGQIVTAECFLASNTSSFSIAQIASFTSSPERVIGLHFFNPVSRMKLVEIVSAPETSSSVVDECRRFVEQGLGKRTVLVKDSPGFVVNALLVPQLLHAIRMAEEGVAAPHDIDTAMELGCAHPMGPLKLADLIGLDTVLAIGENLVSAEEVPAGLREMVSAGKLGRKSGEGFYTY